MYSVVTVATMPKSNIIADQFKKRLAATLAMSAILPFGVVATVNLLGAIYATKIVENADNCYLVSAISLWQSSTC